MEPHVRGVITVTLENGSRYTYAGRMAGHSLLWLASTGFLDDLIDQTVTAENAIYDDSSGDGGEHISHSQPSE